jgi:xanthine/uracil permease
MIGLGFLALFGLLFGGIAIATIISAVKGKSDRPVTAKRVFNIPSPVTQSQTTTRWNATAGMWDDEDREFRTYSGMNDYSRFGGARSTV